MIYVTRTSSGIDIRGHAYYAKSGYDIVCAAVSTAMWTLIRSIEELTGSKIKYDVSPGRATINYEELSESGELLVDSFFIGVREIASEFPKNITISNGADK